MCLNRNLKNASIFDMIRRPTLVLAHKLPSLEGLQIVDSSENVLTFRVKRVFFPIFLMLPNEIRLQYYFNSVSLLGRLKLYVSKFFDLLALVKQFSFDSFVFPYALELPTGHIQYPIKLSNINYSSVWVSRTAISEGVATQTISEEVDWNLKRSYESFLISIFKLRLPRGSRVFLDPKQGLEVVEACPFNTNEVSAVIKFENVSLLHGKNVIQDSKLYFPKYDNKFAFSGWPSYAPFLREKKLFLLSPSRHDLESSGLIFTFDNNWFHFLIETMSALIAFESDIQGENIILPTNTFSQISDALQLFSPRSFIYVNFLDSIQFSELKVIHLKARIGIDLEVRRDDIYKLQEFVACKVATHHTQVRKIYLKRKSGLFRNLDNRDWLEQRLYEKGYQCLELSEMTFLEQYHVVKSASTIVAETGAALTNAVFASPQCRIIELKPKGEYSVFEDLINILGLDYNCIETLPVGKGNYKIDVKDVDKL